MQRSKRWIFSILDIKLVVTIIALSIVGNSIYVNIESLNKQRIEIYELTWLISAILITALSVLVNAYAWNLFLLSLNTNKLEFSAIQIFVKTNIYKYLPGGIWHLVGRFKRLVNHLGIEKTLEGILLEPFLMLVAALLLLSFGGWQSGFLVICLLSPLVFLPILRVNILKKIKSIKGSKFLVNKLSNQPVDDSLDTHSKTASYPFKALFVEILFILVRFFGFWCCLNAFSIGGTLTFNENINAFIFAWIIGLVIPAAPGGVGVFEASILFCLATKLPEAPLLASLLCYRLVSTIADLGTTSFFVFKERFNNRRRLN